MARRILHIDSGRSWRGGQAQVLLALRALERLGLENHLASPAGSELGRRAAATLAPPRLHPVALRGEADLPGALALARLHRQRRFDVMHAHDSHAHAVAFVAGCVASMPPLVVTRRVELPPARNWLGRLKYRRVARIIAISDAVRRALVDARLPAERIEVIASGLDVAEVEARPANAALLQQLGLAPQRPVVMNVGALSPQKDQATFVAAAARVHAVRPEVQFVLLGGGELRGDLERQVERLGLRGVVVLAGFQEDVIGLLRCADLFVLTSVFEGLCSTLLQVMACGVPIVATRVGGVPEVVTDGQTGFLVPPRAPAAAAALIERFLADPAPFASAAARARQEVRRYDYAALAPRIAAEYERAIRGG